MSEPTVTERGFHGYADITTSYGQRLVVQESSAASGPHVWLFTTPPKDYPDLHSPHLNVEQATALRDALNRFLDEVPERWANGEDLAAATVPLGVGARGRCPYVDPDEGHCVLPDEHVDDHWPSMAAVAEPIGSEADRG